MSILRRTVYYDISRGKAMFWDWAKVTTTLGVMAEPFIVGAKFTANTNALVHNPTTEENNFDPDDEINRIDEIRALPIDKEQLILSSSAVDHLMGGTTSPRDGR